MTFSVISVHDVAPATWDESRSLLAEAERIGSRASLLVVPGPWREPTLADCGPFGAWLRAAEADGHEVVVHGWEHRGVGDPDGRVPLTRRWVERVVTRGCAEFSALGEAQATARAGAGLDALRSLGCSPTGFVAPGWSMSPAVVPALAALGFHYTTTRWSIVDLVDDRSIPAPAICHRPGSPLSATGARMMVALVEQRARERRTIRLALHPADTHDDRLVAATQRAVSAIGRSELETATYRDVVAGCRAPHGSRVGLTTRRNTT